MAVAKGVFRDRWNLHQHVRTAELLDSSLDNCAGSRDDSFELWTNLVFSKSFVLEDGYAVGNHFQDQFDSRFDDPRELHLNFMLLKPKSRPQSPVLDRSVSSGFKCAADEFASQQLNGHSADLKQPWQKGALSVDFGKPKRFSEGSYLDPFLSNVGNNDHMTANILSASSPRPSKQMQPCATGLTFEACKDR